MTIDLTVPPRQQQSPMSCWWACMAMILEYYGRHYESPGSLHHRFERPFNQPRGGTTRMRWPSADQMMAMHGDMATLQEGVFLEPYEWYEYGLPRNRGAFELLSELSGFEGFDRPAFGRWTANDVESRLRQYGPYLFCGFWHNFPHAIVVTGLLTDDVGERVVLIDPAQGFPSMIDLSEFNRRMDERMSEFNFNRLNPMYLPNDQPVRGTTNQ